MSRYRITRDYGETANDKVNGLVKSLAEAIITVIALITFYMGWRTGTIVAIAVPITYSLVLLCNYLFGYTINRVTLFALILALGLVVDDPIVSVENIYRHLTMGGKKKLEAISVAINEVMPPVILATLAIIVSFLPMFFITGMMGPYMRPMALNVPLAMLMSMVVSFAITPWVSSKLLEKGTGHGEEPYDITKTANYRLYRRVILPFVNSRVKSLLLLFVIAVLFVVSVGLALTGYVPLKMLPFDNKNEIPGPDRSARGHHPGNHGCHRAPGGEPPDHHARGHGLCFHRGHGLAHGFQRPGASLLHAGGGQCGRYPRQPAARNDRQMSSHAIVLRIRNDIEAIAQATGASIKLIEAPPGPPVLSTVVAEVYGTARHSYDDLIQAADTVKAGHGRQSRGLWTSMTPWRPTSASSFSGSTGKKRAATASPPTISSRP